MNKEQRVEQIPQVRKGFSTTEKERATNIQIEGPREMTCIDLHI